jgi:hypothetical protein
MAQPSAGECLLDDGCISAFGFYCCFDQAKSEKKG